MQIEWIVDEEEAERAADKIRIATERSPKPGASSKWMHVLVDRAEVVSRSDGEQVLQLSVRLR